MKPVSLHDREFIDLYVGGPEHLRANATACYKHLHPGVKQRSAETLANRKLRKVEVSEYLEKRADRISEETAINAAYVLEQAVRILDICMGRTAAPVSIQVGGQTKIVCLRKFDATGALRALEMIGKHVAVQAFRKRDDTPTTNRLAKTLARRQQMIEERARRNQQVSEN